MYSRRLASLILLLVSVLMVSSATAEFRIESLDYNFPEEISEAVADGKQLVIMFHQDNCPFCDKMRTRVFPDAKVDAYYSQKFVMLEANIRGNLEVVAPNGKRMTERKLAKSLRVRATPVFLFFDKSGKQALRLTGFLDAELFVRAGQYVAEGFHKKRDSFYRYLKGAE